MFKTATLGIAALLVLGLTLGVAAQMAVGGTDGPSGGMVLVESGSGSLYPLIYQLRDDNEWATARTALVEQATEGRVVEVVYTLQKMSKVMKDDKVNGRVEAIFGDLQEAGLFPIKTSTVKAELAELKVALKKLRASKVQDKAVPAFLMALRSAEKELARAHVILETGEEPAAKRRQGGRGRVIRVSGDE